MFITKLFFIGKQVLGLLHGFLSCNSNSVNPMTKHLMDGAGVVPMTPLNWNGNQYVY